MKKYFILSRFAYEYFIIFNASVGYRVTCDCILRVSILRSLIKSSTVGWSSFSIYIQFANIHVIRLFLS